MVNFGLVTSDSNYSFVFVSLLVFAIFRGAMNMSTFEIVSFGAKGVFTAFFSAIMTSLMYNCVYRFYRKHKKYIHGAESMDASIHQAIFSLPVLIAVVLFYGVVTFIFFYITEVDNFQEFII